MSLDTQQRLSLLFSNNTYLADSGILDLLNTSASKHKSSGVQGKARFGKVAAAVNRSSLEEIDEVRRSVDSSSVSKKLEESEYNFRQGASSKKQVQVKKQLDISRDRQNQDG